MPEAHFKTILLDVEKQVAVLKFNRPEARNAYDEEMGLELLSALHDLADPEVRAVVVTGEGKDFCVGFDPAPMREKTEEAPLLFRRATGYLHQAVAELRRLPKPVIAGVNGAASGCGFSLTLACDFILAAESATFSSSSINMGLPPEGGLTYFLTRLVGPQKCAELVMTGKTIGSKKALEMGVISGIVPLEKLLEESRNLAIYFANGPTLALGRAKRLIDTSFNHSLEEQLEEERQGMIEASKSQDFHEGLRASVDKKNKPAFKGK